MCIRDRLDIVKDYNDQQECQPVIRKCMMLATYYDASLWAVLHENGSSSAIPVANDDGTLYGMLSRDEIANYNMSLVTAGKLDSAQEDPLFCAQRELSEETGYVAENWRKLTVLETTPGFCNERIHIYLATGLRQGETHPDEDEFVATTRMPLAEAVARVMDGTFRDGKTALGIMMAFTKMTALAHKND